MIKELSCDCNCGVCVHTAFLVVKRDDRVMNVCSRCDLSGDEKLYRLFTKSDIPTLARLDSDERESTDNSFDILLSAFGGIGIVLEAYINEYPEYTESVN